MEDKIERINTYNDKRFDPEILKQHGAFLVNEKFVCQFQIFQRTCAVVTWEGNIDLEALIKEFRFYAEHVTKFYDRNYHLLREYPAISLFRIPLWKIQPSQFYVDMDKTKALKPMIRKPEDIIIPINSFGTRYISLDGHTRLYLVVQKGFEYVSCFFTEDNEICLKFAKEAQRRRVFAPTDLILLPHEEYLIRWVGFCDQFFQRNN